MAAIRSVTATSSAITDKVAVKRVITPIVLILVMKPVTGTQQRFAKKITTHMTVCCTPTHYSNKLMSSIFNNQNNFSTSVRTRARTHHFVCKVVSRLAPLARFGGCKKRERERMREG